MELAARYQDGLVATVRDVVLRVDAATASPRLVITDLATRGEIDSWSGAEVFPLEARKNELRFGVTGKPYGARVAITNRADIDRAFQLLPALSLNRRRNRGRELQVLGIATVALASVIFAYIFGVPLLAGNVVRVLPPQWEADFGNTVAQQVEAQLTEDGGWRVCDEDRNSLANRAIARFAETAMADSGSPFVPVVTVIGSDVPNAFALPGGKAFYFSALLDQTQTPDEFAGVLSHELGHVVHRHVMQTLVSSAGTGLLIGFILGDMTGLSIAGGVGSALINNTFSREAEAEADRFAADTALRMGFDPAALATLLDRVAADDDFTRALALLSTHPLTEERRRALEALANPTGQTVSPFTPEEWLAIKTMCGGAPPPPITPIVGPTRRLPTDAGDRPAN